MKQSKPCATQLRHTFAGDEAEISVSTSCFYTMRTFFGSFSSFAYGGFDCVRFSFFLFLLPCSRFITFEGEDEATQRMPSLPVCVTVKGREECGLEARFPV